MKNITSPFKPRARLLLELGNQLIKDEGIALFELVKNSYDADATEVKISLKNIDSLKKGEITIRDNGCGMDWDIVTNVWMEPGTDYREKQILTSEKTRKFKRLPLGQKGIGRFGAHKLGRYIELITKSKDNNEIVVVIDWNKFNESKYLEDIPVNVYERNPEIFTDNKTGTKIRIYGLWNRWNRGMTRNMYRAVNSICSPFKSPDSFKAILEIIDKNKQDWFKDLFTWREAVDYKLFKATCSLENDKLSYIYEFIPWETMTIVTGRKVDTIEEKKEFYITDDDTDDNNEKIINLSKYQIGKIKIELYIFDLDSNILTLGVHDKSGLKKFLKFNGGIRVYRDGVRVYDYGEPGNDWLDLGGRRVNIPSARLSNNLVIGEVSINRSDSTDLEEKT
ncbi:MAG: ATP-binding protein, partial [Candidatus Heimdallarchaeota archaeon]|nr:ATP-binding protein [Candidatus Heimdallarchaeota archaeon]